MDHFAERVGHRARPRRVEAVGREFGARLLAHRERGGVDGGVAGRDHVGLELGAKGDLAVERQAPQLDRDGARGSVRGPCHDQNRVGRVVGPLQVPRLVAAGEDRGIETHRIAVDVVVVLVALVDFEPSPGGGVEHRRRCGTDAPAYRPGVVALALLDYPAQGVAVRRVDGADGSEEAEPLSGLDDLPVQQLRRDANVGPEAVAHVRIEGRLPLADFDQRSRTHHGEVGQNRLRGHGDGQGLRPADRKPVQVGRYQLGRRGRVDRLAILAAFRGQRLPGAVEDDRRLHRRDLELPGQARQIRFRTALIDGGAVSTIAAKLEVDPAADGLRVDDEYRGRNRGIARARGRG